MPTNLIHLAMATVQNYVVFINQLVKWRNCRYFIFPKLFCFGLLPQPTSCATTIKLSPILWKMGWGPITHVHANYTWLAIMFWKESMRPQICILQPIGNKSRHENLILCKGCSTPYRQILLLSLRSTWRNGKLGTFLICFWLPKKMLIRSSTDFLAYRRLSQ